RAPRLWSIEQLASRGRATLVDDLLRHALRAQRDRSAREPASMEAKERQQAVCRRLHRPRDHVAALARVRGALDRQQLDVGVTELAHALQFSLGVERLGHALAVAVEELDDALTDLLVLPRDRAVGLCDTVPHCLLQLCNRIG